MARRGRKHAQSVVPTLLSASTRFFRAHDRNEFCTFILSALPPLTRRPPLPLRFGNPSPPDEMPEPPLPGVLGPEEEGDASGDGHETPGAEATTIGGTGAGEAVEGAAAWPPSGEGRIAGRARVARSVWYAAFNLAKRIPVPAERG